ncbi:DMT family transporter [Pseudooceanicola sp.]|uniref:DMT family transporter n=1 Tax=Pseudooceanicola sp. TaxID=1914328 RepID=UPI00405915CA
MSDLILSLEGTEAGHRLALILALTAAFLHAFLGAIQKGRIDPWLSRGAIDTAFIVLTLPIALFFVPRPEGREWLLILGTMPFMFVYKWLLALAYTRAAYTVVYPVVRGSGPFFTVLGAWLLIGETFTPTQWTGVGVLMGGILGLAVYNMRHVQVDRERLVPALWLAVATGLAVAGYTTWGAFAIRGTADPFTYLAWFFVVTAVDMPLIAAWRWRRMSQTPPVRDVFRLGVTGAVIGWGSFGTVMLATRLDKVGEAAVLRETSTVFAAMIGWLVLKETVGPRRVMLMTLIALGAVIVELGG